VSVPVRAVSEKFVPSEIVVDRDVVLRQYPSPRSGGVTYDEFVRYLDRSGVALCLQGGEIVVQAPDEMLTAEFRALARK
jgi:hypothetical protein